MEDLLISQHQLINAIDHLLVNFKKDGPERKTVDYIKRRLSTLDGYWTDFQTHHAKLLEIGDKTHSYFVNNQYEITQNKYTSVRAIIESYRGEQKAPPSPLLRPATPLAPPSGSGTMQSQGINSKTEELLKKQSSNFRAFERTVNNIDLNLVTEKWEYEDLLRTLQSRWSVIDSLHWELDYILEGSNTAYEETFSRYESSYNNIKKSINSKLWSVSHMEKTTPRMDVPIFSGSYQQWISFKDLFMEAIHNNPSISKAQKMQFLKNKLRGEAEKLIQHLQISADNYSICWEILNHRYNNLKLIFSSHASVIMNLPNIQQASAQNIKKLHDTTKECLNAIKSLGVNTITWDPLLVYILANKLDADTHSDYVASLKQPRELPKLSEFMDFLESKFTAMESSRRKETPSQKAFSQNIIQSATKTPKFNNLQYTKNGNVSQPATSKKLRFRCPVCSTNEHKLYYCKHFLSMSPYQQRRALANNDICQNCIYYHNGQNCLSEKRCRECNGFHNTLLHHAFAKNATQTSSRTEAVSHALQNEHKENASNANVSQQNDTTEILLATAMVNVRANDGTKQTMRALIDQGSQTSLITERAAQALALPRKRGNGIISGVGTKESSCKGIISVTLESCTNDFTLTTNTYIMKNIVKNLPTHTFPKPASSYLENVKLADPEFYLSRPVDLLLGADVYSSIILDGIIRADKSMPIAQQTELGWILSGGVHTLQCNVITNSMDDFHKFWEMEEISNESELSTEDQRTLDFYKSTTKRCANGSYEVRIPLKPESQDQLGSSKPMAMAQFRQIEKKFTTDQTVAEAYKSFMNEYESLGHMKASHSNPTLEYFMPHHCVLRPESTSSALRVVFNASAKTTSGLSLNDCMERGPNLQQDLQGLIIRWRQYRFVCCADIEKMFRQILVQEQDQHYQKIVWRESTRAPIQEYQLTTVTYGTKAAPFLAMMTLKQLALDEQENFPEASQIVQNSFYMDDLLCGSNDSETARRLVNELITLLQRGGFNLRKWKSNENSLLPDQTGTPKSSDKHENFEFKEAESSKTLGLRWNPQKDSFTFESKIESAKNAKETKRTLLSDISKVFDPLGWLTPVTMKLKSLYQAVWRANIQWDDELPSEIKTEWLKIRADIANINQYKISRWIRTGERESIELHGFCDASSKGFACVIYCKTRSEENEAKVVMVAGKSKLVPTNKQVSLPRLELCGAELLANLMQKVKENLNYRNIDIYGWIDSQVVLAWIQGDSNRWKTFVANRVTKIKKVMEANCWKYIKSSENPADCASRGLTASQLKDHSLWWDGPTWLPTYRGENESNQQSFTTDEEVKKNYHVNTATQQKEKSIIENLLDKYSSYSRVVRVLAWILRFISKKHSKTSYLSLAEEKRAKEIINKYVQKTEFSAEIKSLEENGTVSNKSSILNLQPYLDKNGILRVGGRLKNANIHDDMKHPIIVPKKSRLTELLIDHSHKLTFHGGARLTSSFIRQKFWIVGGNRAVKKQIRMCIKCRKHAPNLQHQLMGDLPEARTNPSRPFENTGIDFTGHVTVKSSKGRGIKCSKGYVAVFVCMATKSIHLELVSDMSTSAFLAALRRMASRRGKPSHIYSDNGTNFVGANKILQQEYHEIKQLLNDDQLMSEITDMEITWHFNAPGWPSAGGLWEAAVKSLKHHLRRVVGEQRLTYEEFYTLLAQLEACLNARPLCPLTEDPEDLNYLTPSHFLSSGPVLTLVETEKDLRTRWTLTQKIFNDIWKRWRTEYLTQLTSRSKWSKEQQNISIGDVVLIHEENLPPGKWMMGRVSELHPGKDGLVRVVTLKTKNKYIKRPVVKISKLPIYNKSETQQNTSDEASDDKLAQQTATEPKHTRKGLTQRNKQLSLYSIITSLLLLLTIFSPAQCSFNKTALKNSLYFDEIANMKVVRDEWKIVTYFNMDPYWQATNALRDYTTHLGNACTKFKNQALCDVILQQLRHGQSELEHYERVLLSQHSSARPGPPLSPASSRTRRGLINGVGYIANSLFGVLDERFAEQYHKDIKLLNMNQQHLVSLWHNQTSVVEAQYNLLKRTENAIDKQYKTINQHFLSIEKASKQQNSELQAASITSEFSIGAIIASNMLQNLRTVQNMLLDTITDIYNGRFNAHLISPEQLKDELSVISSQIPVDLSLPICNIQTDLQEIYHLLRIKSRMMKDYLIFEIRLPLISRETFNIFRVIPVPLKQGSSTVSIKPIAQFIAVNLQKDSFSTLSEMEMKSCLQYYPNVYLCHLQRPIIKMKGDKSLCDLDNTAGECKTTTSRCRNEWTETNKINQFMYFCCEECPVRIMCQDHIATTQLTQAGIIAVGQGCVIKTYDFTVYGHKDTYSSIIKTSPDIVAPEIPAMNYLINISYPTGTTLNDPDEEERHRELDKIHRNIESMKGQEGLTSEMSYHDVHHYAITYIILIAMIAIGASLAWRRWKSASPSRPAGTPAQEDAEAAVAANAAPPQQTVAISDSVKCKCRDKQFSVVNNRSISESALPKISEQKRLVNKGTSPTITRSMFSLSDNSD